MLAAVSSNSDDVLPPVVSKALIKDGLWVLYHIITNTQIKFNSPTL